MRVQVKVEVWYEVEFYKKLTKRQITKRLITCGTLADVYELEEVSDVYHAEEMYANIALNAENTDNIWFEK